MIEPYVRPEFEEFSGSITMRLVYDAIGEALQEIDREVGQVSEYIVDTFGIVQDFADLHGDMNTPLYQAIMNVMVSRQREEIVRCRDCERVTIDQGDHDYREPLWCGFFHTDVSLDGFCAWGREKRSE